MRDETRQLVEDEVRGEYDVLAELGRAPGLWLFLARRNDGADLVVVKLEEQPSETRPDLSLAVATRLDDDVSLPGRLCGACGRHMDGWAGRCAACNNQDFEPPGPSTRAASRDALLAAVRDATRDDFDLLGDLEVQPAGRLIYFAREAGSGRLTGLCLHEDPDETGDFSLRVVWKEPIESVGAQRSGAQGDREISRGAGNPVGNAVARPATFSETGSELRAPPPDAWEEDDIGASGPRARRRSSAPLEEPLEPRVRASHPPTGRTSGPPLSTSWPRSRWIGIIGLVLVLILVIGLGRLLRVGGADVGEVHIGGGLPADISVSVDGQPAVGRRLVLSSGTHTIVVEAAGFRPDTFEVNIRRGDITRWQPVLEIDR